MSVLEGNTGLRRLQPKTVFIPRAFVFHPCFCCHVWERGQQDNARSSLFLFLDPGHIPNSFVVFLSLSVSFFLDCVYLFLERGDGREKERERNIDLLPLAHTKTRGQAGYPGMCPDRESNRGPFTLWDNTGPTKPHLSGLCRDEF